MSRRFATEFGAELKFTFVSTNRGAACIRKIDKRVSPALVRIRCELFTQYVSLIGTGSLIWRGTNDDDDDDDETPCPLAIFLSTKFSSLYKLRVHVLHFLLRYSLSYI